MTRTGEHEETVRMLQIIYRHRAEKGILRPTCTKNSKELFSLFRRRRSLYGTCRTADERV